MRENQKLKIKKNGGNSIFQILFLVVNSIEQKKIFLFSLKGKLRK